MASKPEDVLTSNIGKVVKITLKNGRVFKGTLKGFDEYINLVLGGVEEITGEETKKSESVIIRGNNISVIAPVK